MNYKEWIEDFLWVNIRKLIEFKGIEGRYGIYNFTV